MTKKSLMVIPIWILFIRNHKSNNKLLIFFFSVYRSFQYFTNLYYLQGKNNKCQLSEILKKKFLTITINVNLHLLLFKKM